MSAACGWSLWRKIISAFYPGIKMVIQVPLEICISPVCLIFYNFNSNGAVKRDELVSCTTSPTHHVTHCGRQNENTKCTGRGLIRLGIIANRSQHTSTILLRKCVYSQPLELSWKWQHNPHCARYVVIPSKVSSQLVHGFLTSHPRRRETPQSPKFDLCFLIPCAYVICWPPRGFFYPMEGIRNRAWEDPS